MSALTQRHCTFPGRVWELAHEQRQPFAAEGLAAANAIASYGLTFDADQTSTSRLADMAEIETLIARGHGVDGPRILP
jgi:hypothetical protein